jgi:CHAT domain-containing protein
LGAAASRARLAGDLRDCSVLHLACHGFVDARTPGRTGIALSPTEQDDGYFTIADALELDLDADLVVLSACETAQGEMRAGEGIESLARAFLYSGARGVVASLWQVDDRAAARTMELFYRAWLEEGRPPARALREAKLALLRGELELGPARGVALGAQAAPGAAAGHPSSWAPFVHVGMAR